MTVGFLKDIQADIPQNVRLLGVDVGKRMIGLAVCDHAHTLVTPLKTIRRTKFSRDMSVLAEVVKDYEIGGFVVGLPIDMDADIGVKSSEGRAAQSVRDFVSEMLNFENVVGVQPWVAFYDERLSTSVAEDFIDEGLEMKRSKAKDRGITDQLAAVLILEDALSALD